MLKNRLIRWLAVAFTLLSVACSTTTDSPTAPGRSAPGGSIAAEAALVYPLIAVQPAADSVLAIGKTASLSALVTTSPGESHQGATIKWSSSNAAVVSVSGSSTAVVTAHEAGSATITAVSASDTKGTLVIRVPAGVVTPPPPPSGTWNLPAGFTVVCQTGAITASSPHLSNVTGTSKTAGTINLGGPVPCAWNRNGGNGSIGLSSSPSNPDGSANTDPQPSGYRVVFPAGQVNDPAWDMYFDHAGGTGTYYIGWKERQEAFGSYAALKAAMNSSDSKVWAPKGPSGGDLTIMSWMDFSYPIIGLNFQGEDGSNIPDNNQTGKSTTVPVVAADKLPGVAAGGGVWDQEEVLITSTGTVSTSSVCFYVNGVQTSCAHGVTNAKAWTATENYLSRSVYSGTQKTTLHMDIDQVTVAVK